MKKVLLSIPLLYLLAATSCEKEPEVVTETVTVTDTVTVTKTDTITVTVKDTLDQSVAVTVEPYTQTYYTSLGYYSSVTQNFSVTNLGSEEYDWVRITFEATTADGAKYSGSSSVFDLAVGETLSGQAYISVADKQCTSVKVKKVEVTIY